MHRRRLSFCLLLLLSCAAPQKPEAVPVAVVPPGGTANGGPVAVVAGPELPLAEGESTGLVFRLQPGRAEATKAPAAHQVTGKPLTAAEADKLLAKLPALPKTASLATSFAKRPSSSPPPSAFDVTLQEFPQSSTTKAEKPAVQPLAVLRAVPNGDVPFAPELTVTFNQPMIALDSHDATVAKGVPVKLTPEPKGKWRWLGSRTLAFSPEQRFPMATEYRVEVTAGTAAPSGAKLAQTFTQAFRTPPAQQEANSLRDTVPTSTLPVVAVRFDQRVKQAEAIAQAQFCTKKACVAARVPSEAELKANPEAFNLWQYAHDEGAGERVFAVIPVQELPLDSDVQLRLGRVPSAEGSRLGDTQTLSFHTHGAFKVLRAGCGYQPQDACSPDDTWSVELSNEVDPKSLDLAAFAVSPQVKLLGVSQSWASRGANAIAVQAESRARTKYELTLPASVRDIFGQALGKPVTVSISVGDPRPDLGNAEPMIVLDPAGPRALELLTRGIPDLRVRVSRVTPNDLPAFFQFLQRDNGAELAQLPGTQVLDTKLNVKDTLQYVTSFANVEKALHGGFGHAVVVVEPVKWPDTYRPRLRSWVQSTELGLNVIHDADTLYVWVTKLADGSALPNATITLEPDGTQVTSDARGFAKIDLPTGAGKGMRSVTARVGGDVTVYPERMWDGGGQPSNWVKRESQDTLRFFAFDDRGLYRPGERVHVKGWVRATQGGYGGKLVLPRAMHGLRYVVRDGNGQEIKSGQLQPSASYGFDFAFDLPDQATLGYAQVEITANDGKQDVSTGLGIQVAEFRRPEYEVSLRAKEAVHVMGETIGVEAEAKYYTGGALVDTAAQFRVTSQRGSFTPPGRDDYQFGEPPLWLFWERMPNTSRANLQTARVLTGADGIAPLDIVPVSLDPAYPHTLSVEVAVQDVNRQTWAANTELLVHPSRTYVGLKLDRAFIAQGQSVEATLLAVDLDGKAAPGRKVEVRGVRHDTESSQGETKQVERDVQLCTFTSTDAPSKCTFKPAQAGSYELTARVIDDVGRANQTRTSIWVTGPTTTGPSNLEEGQVQVVADRKEYKAGDVAHVLLQSPFAPANASVVIAHAGVRKLEQVRIENATHTLDIPIEAGFAPNVTIMVSLVGSRELRDPGTDAKRQVPAYASGSVALTVPVAEQRLEVIAKPAVAELEPGGHTRIEVTVRDAAHAPVANAETCVIVVDEAVLAMAQYEPGDPIAAMFPELPPDVDSFDTRAYLRLANAERSQRGRPVLLQSRGGLGRLGRGAGGGGMVAEAAMAAPAPMAPGARHKGMVAAEDKAAGNAVRQAAPVLRQSFSSIALFAPKLVTDANGVARTELVLPDDLTRYRIFALAAANGDHFGHGEGTVTARKQLMLRASPPRFLSFGDRFELPVVIENQAASVQSVQLAGRAANAAFTAARGLRVEVPAHDRVEVRLPMAALAAGRATLQLVVKSDAASDATQLSLPVWTPATDEAFATYGSLAQEKVVAQPVHAPSDVFPEFGGLEIATSSTQLAALTDALRYVNEYPFECSEQLASRAITLLALRDVLASFVGAQVPSADEAKAAVHDAVQKLLKMQNDDGGFPWWERNEQSAAYNTLHALHALVRAHEAGDATLEPAIERGLAIAPQLIRNEIEDPQASRALRAYLLYIESLRGENEVAAVTALWREKSKHAPSVETVGWLLSALGKNASQSPVAKELLGSLDNRASETASMATFTESYSDAEHVILHSDERSNAIALEGVLHAAPDHDLAPKLAKGLLAHQKQGRWGNTQENVFAALALRAYFDHYEKDVPSFDARVFLGAVLALDGSYHGRTTQQASTTVPMRYLAEHPRESLVVQKIGTGRMYYRLGLSYAPKSLALAPTAQGFEVERSYEGVDDPSDVTRDASGTWYVKAGARVRANVTMVAKARRFNVALVDPLAAGFEPMQASLHGMQQDPGSGGAPCPVCKMWWGPWWEHQNERDERSEAFTSTLDGGVYTYSHMLRATTPGEFIVAPAKAEEMYTPETFGRSGSDRVVVR